MCCLLAERHDALLGALPLDSQLLLLEVDVAEVQRHSLAAAQAGGVDQLDQRAVPDPERAVGGQRGERLVDVALLRRVRQPSHAPRRERRIGHARRAERETEEAPDRRQLPADRRRRELARPGATELGRVRGQCSYVHVVERHPTPLEPVAELPDVDPVGLSGPVGKGR